ncbi:hypothetical protein [Amantichitinum ursilacus]|uniref:Nickel uptake substrate-specific transmembrane region n=1 Tax=Amantichitinum ursilacus TaxID=857265 RepID=A0A0N0XM45_9NEIS|nr:hypothetical protein [Amantichitinum ursilacus]KPC54307.1 hypothetical protein WG78_06645 [Amantichitinum ursilacus]
MKKQILLSLSLALALLNGAAVAADDAALRAKVVGTYHLQGERETGSGLRLTPDGRFEWSMSYGAVDQYAKGNWTLQGSHVLLEPVMARPQFRLFTEEESRFKPAAPGSWVAVVGVPNVGPIPDIEVQFVSRSGKTVTKASLPNGDAEIAMPKSEIWARAGLRRKDSKDDWQWIDIPAPLAAARIAGFAVDDISSVAPAPFKQMVLDASKDEGLAWIEVDGQHIDRTLTYSRD